MTAPKHTPGPWWVEEDGGYFDIRSEARVWAIVGNEGCDDQANARLIAAVPELYAYAECEEARRLSLLPTSKGGTGDGQSYLATFQRHGFEGRDVGGFLDKLRRAALAKARGESNG